MKLFARLGSVALLLVAVVAVGACAPSPASSSGPPVTVVPSSCPFENTVMLVGDSLGVGYGRQLTVPERDVFAASLGGASFSQVSALETIIARTHRWLETCGRPDLLVVEGGINDLLNGITASQLIEVVAEFDRFLAAEGVPTLWVTIPPLAEPGGYSSLNPARRQYNDWLLSPGTVSGSVVNVSPAMEAGAGSDVLDQAFWWYWNDIFKPDGIHPNEAGYKAMAATVGAAIDGELAG